MRKWLLCVIVLNATAALAAYLAMCRRLRIAGARFVRSALNAARVVRGIVRLSRLGRVLAWRKYARKVGRLRGAITLK